MFDRSRSDYAPEPAAIAVEVSLGDGTVTAGRLLAAMGKTLGDVLNGAGGFVEFEPYGGARTFLAKTQLASVRPIDMPRAPSLGARLADPGGFNPHAVLGVAPGAPHEEVRHAYFRLAKAYHPDRYATAELPAEVRDYLAAMARRINAAHAALETSIKKQAARAEPAFASTGR